MRHLILGLLVWAVWPAYGQQPPEKLFLEVPMMLDAPGQQQVIRTWHDGEHFFVDTVMLLEKLGFNVRVDQLKVTALDANRLIALDYALRQQLAPQVQVLGNNVIYADGRFLLSIAGLERIFGSDIHFDENRLNLRISTSAQLFNAAALHHRRPLWAEAPGPLKFGRDRSIWGGLMVNWQVHRQPGYLQAAVDITGSLMAGTLQAYLGTNRQALTYLYDRPQSKHLTRLEFGRFAEGISGVRLSNRPLVRRQLQRIHVIKGQAEPHSLVAAHISGHVIDQVQADAHGWYQLRAPLWYGTNVVELRTRRLGGGRETVQRQYHLADHALAEPGRFYYDIKGGRLPYGAAVDGTMEYGLADAFTVRAGAGWQPDHAWLETGGTWNPLSLLNLSASLRWPSGSYAASMHIWRRGVNISGQWYERQHGGSGLKLQAAGMKGPVSLNLSASQYRNAPFWQLQTLSPSAWINTPGGMILRAMWHYERSHHRDRASHVRQHWRISGGMPIARAHTFLNVGGRGKRWFIGLEGFVALRGWSMGFTANVDMQSGLITGGISIQANTPVATLAMRAHQIDAGLVHTQSLYGQVTVDRSGLSLNRDVHQTSAARLIVFRDTNSNGHRDADEPILPNIRAQLYHAHWTRDKDGTLYAMHLDPFNTYQVRILEASVRDPRLQPATGYAFSFIADPGRTKRLLVPMQPLLQVAGRLVNPDRPPNRLRVRISSGSEVPVYRDGGFTLLLQVGRYEISVADVLTQEILHTGPVHIDEQTRELTINLDLSSE